MEWSAPPELTAAVTFRRFPPRRPSRNRCAGKSLVALRGCFCGRGGRCGALIDGSGPPSDRPPSTPSPPCRPRRWPPSAWTRSTRWRAEPPRIPARPHPGRHRRSRVARRCRIRIAAGDAGAPPTRRRAQRSARCAQPDGPHSAGYSLNAIGVTPTPSRPTPSSTTCEGRRRHATARHRGAVTSISWTWTALRPSGFGLRTPQPDWDRLTRLKAHYDPQKSSVSTATSPVHRIDHAVIGDATVTRQNSPYKKVSTTR